MADRDEAPFGGSPDERPDDTRIDQLIRRDLDLHLPRPEHPQIALDLLEPSFVRARRARRLQLVGSAAAGLVVVLGGLAVLRGFDGDEATTVAGPPTTVDGAEPETTGSTIALEVTGSTIDHDDPAPTGPTVTSPDDDADDGAGTTGNVTTATSEADTSPTAGDTTATIGSTAPPTSIAPTTPDPSPTTSALSTSTPLPGETVIESSCGDVVVRVEGSSVWLVRVDADPRVEEDVKSSGPEKVEVGLERHDEHCEIRAEVRRGRLVTSVDDGDEHDDD